MYVPFVNSLTLQWFNIFNILFEVVSGYACVGLSIVSPHFVMLSLGISNC
jgi:Trk-type K+ transport system membrane component